MKLEEEIAQKQFKNEYQKASINIIYTNNWLSNKAAGLFKEFDITQQQYNVLRILRGQYPKPCPVNTIKERMLDKMCDASRIVDRLKIKGLLIRTKNDLDRRAVDIIISEKGLSLLEALDQHVSDLDTSIRNLTEEEVVTLNTLLDKIRE